MTKVIFKYMKWTALSASCGLLSGLAATVFLFLLDFATSYRESQTYLIWFLPLAGFVIGWIYLQYGQDVVAGNQLIFQEIRDPQKVTPLRMAPLILFSTLVTHLFGGSAGREGTAVQMGASLSDQLSRFFKVSREERKILLVAGVGSGFGAAIGAPWAGIIFGMEVVSTGKLKIFALLECAVASFVAFWVTKILAAPHSHYPHFLIPEVSLMHLLWVALAGVAFGFAAFAFVKLTHFVEGLQKRFVRYPPIRPMLGGLVLLFLFWFAGSDRYLGLGIPVIQEALSHMGHWFDPLAKTLFTSVTIGSGFKGGEFVPLVFIGTTLGSFLGLFLPVSFQLLAGLGFASVFAAASKTPWACTLMAMEIFGPRIAPFALIACWISTLASGKVSIYRYK